MEEIKLIQLPVIQHRVTETGRRVSERIEALNLSKQVATEDTIRALKILRSELNKESASFEEQKKVIKDALLAPYNEFEALYKSNIIEKYKAAEELLKAKINNFELTIKGEKRRQLIAYFDEYCKSLKIDFVPFDKVLPDGVGLSVSITKYKESIDVFMDRVVTDLKLIKTEEFADEIMVEYKKTLNQPMSILTVRERKEAERKEAKQRIVERTQRRREELKRLDFVFHQFTDTFNWEGDQNILIKMSDLESMEEINWQSRIAEMNFVINKIIKERNGAPEILQAPQAQAPAPETQPEMCEACFLVTETFDRLMLLKEFLINNKYNYQNIQS